MEPTDTAVKSKTSELPEEIKSKPKNPKTIETEVYFNSLLQAQSQNDTTSKSRTAKYVSFGILIIMVIIGVYLAASLFINSNNITTTDSSALEEGKTGAYFDPSFYANKERIITGKINKNLNDNINEMQQFELLGNNGKTIAYLFSKNHDLNLSIGLQVEIQGQLIESAADGKEIVEVRTIKLK